MIIASKAQYILTIGSDKGRDKYVNKVIKLATELQGEDSEESEDSSDGACSIE
jgi:hypothetical protein